MKIVFNTVKGKYGWLGNMAPFPIRYQNQIWRTSEALFQAMRFEDKTVREMIRNEKSPMAAKMKAKKMKHLMVVEPMSDFDLENMGKCVRLKFEQHPELVEALVKTGNEIIIEDIGNRNGERHLFWGAKKISETEFEGKNRMGEILMELRKEMCKHKY